MQPISSDMHKKIQLIKEKYRRLLDIKLIIALIILLVVFIKFKNIFFTIFFISLNVLLVILAREFDFFNPIKIMDFAVFMCAYT